jgi:hypothetical protein
LTFDLVEKRLSLSAVLASWQPRGIFRVSSTSSTSITGCALVASTGARGIDEAELVGVQQDGIALANVEMFFFLGESGALLHDLSEETTPQCLGKISMFFVCELDVELVPLFELDTSILEFGLRGQC